MLQYEILTLACILLSGIAFYLRWLRKNDDYWEKRGVSYYPRQSITSGLLKMYSLQFHKLYQDLHKTYGRIHGFFEFRKPALTINDPELLRDILVKDFNVFSSRRELDVRDPLLSKMITVMNGEDWKRVRCIVSPCFTSRRMRQISHIINECSENVIQIFEKHHAKGEPVDVKSIFGAFTMDVIARSAFATKIDSINDPENIFIKNAKKTFLQPSLKTLLYFFILPRWFTWKFSLGIMDPLYFFKNIILQVIKERNETGKKYDDILQLLLDTQEELQRKNTKEQEKNEMYVDETDHYGSVTSSEVTFQKKYKRLSDDELIAQCIIFFTVGYETTASVMSFMAYSLALNPECQEKLIKEVDEVFERNGEIHYDVIREMKYLDCVVSETLRMYPPAVRSERTASQDYKLGNTGIIIEKGTLVGFSIYAMHYDPDFFPNPDIFDPERFKPENANYPNYAYLPFGAGPRNCQGMRFALLEMKQCMCNILRHYKFKKAETTKVPLEFKSMSAILSVTDLPLLLEKRNRN